MRFLLMSCLMLFLLSSAGCEKSASLQTENPVSLDQIQAQAQNAAPAPPNTAVMYVHGMGCPQCAYNVDLQLLKLKGVKAVKVDMSVGMVTAQLSPENPPSKEQLVKAIKQTGFTLITIEMP